MIENKDIKDQPLKYRPSNSITYSIMPLSIYNQGHSRISVIQSFSALAINSSATIIQFQCTSIYIYFKFGIVRDYKPSLRCSRASGKLSYCQNTCRNIIARDSRNTIPQNRDNRVGPNLSSIAHCSSLWRWNCSAVRPPPVRALAPAVSVARASF